MQHTEHRMSEYPPEVRGKVQRLLAELRAALRAGNPTSLEAAERRLTDLLFDVS
jgi:hypothetical protein